MEETTLSQTEPAAVKHVTIPPAHRDAIGTAVGLLVFLGGVALLALTFKVAYGLFTAPPENTLGIQHGKALDLAKAGDSAASLVLRIVLLVVMAFVGSNVANRGIALYAGARGLRR